MIPVLQTGRLTLRGPRRDDFPPYAAFWASPRSVHEGGPRDTRAAWEDFAAGFGLWTIEGVGTWSVEERATGAFCGIVGLYHPVHFPETEIGWALLEPFEGRGIAFEAARAALDWAWATTSLPSLVSYIDKANARSIRLAERLGAVADPQARPSGPGEVVMRHHRPGGPR
ncbi:GNAT family N-acetyltransferase [Rubellimicrobium sp. CFH 75288]|uniref:GNAT family N-acetyltransferase n=1 Tax=Rubellimicrobium sp. CFH 75288 TaxID=2697034 RepID=UPI001412FBBA|nr:GNAT family N-acetyltransferase [Rubellimicrobium sp. CFH 75288]NAZ37962.1 GNAT family N-acetyltransferase [Rubellimicrobium sp. CFH 75288]